MCNDRWNLAWLLTRHNENDEDDLILRLPFIHHHLVIVVLSEIVEGALSNSKTAVETMNNKKNDNDSPKKGKPQARNGTSNNTNTKKKRAGSGTGLNDMFIMVFGIAFVLSLSLNVLHGTGMIDDLPHEVPTHVHHAVNDFKDLKHTKPKLHHTPKLPQDHEIERDEGNHHDEPLEEEEEGDLPRELANARKFAAAAEKEAASRSVAHLNCEAYGGPSPEVAQEMIYWKDIPSDGRYQSPFMLDETEEKFITFEPDGGGWNNIRMAMETVFGLAIAMGRTLVMPPQKRMYLLGKGDNDQQKHFSFVDFFPVYEMAKENDGFKVISMQEYLQSQAMTGKLKNQITGMVEFPPGNRTNWDGINQKDYDILRNYLRNVTEINPTWKPGQCLPAFPSSSSDHKDVVGLKELLGQARKTIPEGTPPINVNDEDPVMRLEETLSGRKELCVYDEKLQAAKSLHFQCNHKAKLRLLVHFYAFLFFEDWVEDLWMKRFIRDHVRYIDEIQCAAARVVQGVRDHVRKKTGDALGTFDTFHIRRGDFQFKTTRIPAEEIYENSKAELTEGATIFIATDERDKKFFEPLRKHYDILFLDDFKDSLKGVNTNYYGMIDQLVASKGRIFFGCWFSTFTGYIMRLRGYHSTNLHQEGYQNGVLPTSYYYATKDRKLTMHTYAALRGGFFNREFPTAWRDIDQGINMIEGTDAAAEQQ